MKKLLKGLLIIILLIGLFGLGMYVYVGGFKSVTVTKGEFKASEIIFAIHKGAYKDLSKSWDKFKASWEAAGLKSCDSLAVYFDPPGTPDEKLRSVLGCRIDALGDAEKAKLREKMPNFKLPAAQSLVSSFPYKNVMSFFVGPTRVYPEMRKIVEAEKLPTSVAIETYGTVDAFQTMGYYMPTSTKQSDYQKLIDAFK